MFMKPQFFYSYLACLLLLTANVGAEELKPQAKTIGPTKKAIKQNAAVESAAINNSATQVQKNSKATAEEKPTVATKNKTAQPKHTNSKKSAGKQCPTMNLFIPDNCVDAVRTHYLHKPRRKPATTCKPKRLINSMHFAPYVGVEYMYQHVPTSADWHSGDFMPSNLDAINGFVGLRYHRNFAIEVGGYHTIRRSQGQSNVTEFEGQVASGDTLVIAQLENKGFSIDWTAHCFWDPKFNVFALVGMANYQPKLTIHTSENTDLGNALRLVKGHNTNVFRLGVGMEYLECWWGARARVIWDNTHSMRLDVIEAQQIFSAISPRAFGQTIVVTVGLFYRF